MPKFVKICAESQLDDPNAKFAAVAAVWKHVKDGSTIKDLEAIELMEWATTNLIDPDDFAETLGPLRVRAVKASPKDKFAATRSLESCLLHWDLASAQQVNSPASYDLLSSFKLGIRRSQDIDCGHYRSFIPAGERLAILEYCHHAPPFCEYHVQVSVYVSSSKLQLANMSTEKLLDHARQKEVIRYFGSKAD